MVYLAPPLRALLEIRLQIEHGVSVPQAIRIYTQRNIEDDFSKELAFWLFAKETGKDYNKNLFNNPYRKHLLELLSRGIQGEPILSALSEFEQELVFASNENMEQYLQKLPFMSLIPLMIFAFPAFFLLLTGPLVLDLISALQSTGVE